MRNRMNRLALRSLSKETKNRVNSHNDDKWGRYFIGTRPSLAGQSWIGIGTVEQALQTIYSRDHLTR